MSSSKFVKLLVQNKNAWMGGLAVVTLGVTFKVCTSFHLTFCKIKWRQTLTVSVFLQLHRRWLISTSLAAFWLITWIDDILQQQSISAKPDNSHKSEPRTEKKGCLNLPMSRGSSCTSTWDCVWKGSQMFIPTLTIWLGGGIKSCWLVTLWSCAIGCAHHLLG